mmetsp:Transcript_79086/g.201273  ORF Transcript_79086/g.201273 Transcript_79086/m.201273 type:complete len:272 (-) Transcript_79086:545-1360(-)
MAERLEDESTTHEEAGADVELASCNQVSACVQRVLQRELLAIAPHLDGHALAHNAEVPRRREVDPSAEQAAKAELVERKAVELQQHIAPPHRGLRRRLALLGEAGGVHAADEDARASAEAQRPSQRGRLQRLVVTAQRRQPQAQRRCRRWRFSKSNALLAQEHGDLCQKALDQRRRHRVALQLHAPGDELLEGDPHDVRSGRINQRSAAVAAVDGGINGKGEASTEGVRILLDLHAAHHTLGDAASVTTHGVADDSDFVEDVRQLRGGSDL